VSINLVVGTNTYVSLTDAQSYWIERQLTAPSSLEESLIKATDFLEQWYSFIGIPKTNDQRLHFPIKDLILPDGRKISSAGIPQRIKDATAYVAYVIGSEKYQTTGLRESGKFGIKKTKVDVVEVEYAVPVNFDSESQEIRDVMNLRYIVGMMVRDLLKDSGKVTRDGKNEMRTVRLVATY